MSHPKLKQEASCTENRIFETTGADPAYRARQLIRWKGKTTMGVWKSADANRVTGYSGSFMHPSDLKSPAPITVFLPTLSRHARMVKNKNESNDYYTALILEPEILLSASIYPRNKVYFMYGFSGMFNLSEPVLTFGTPVYVSKPPLFGRRSIFTRQRRWRGAAF